MTEQYKDKPASGEVLSNTKIDQTKVSISQRIKNLDEVQALRKEQSESEQTRQQQSQSLIDSMSDQQDNRKIMGAAAVVATLVSLKYMQVVFYSQEKWFHFSIMAMVAFCSIQMHQWYLNQKQIDAKIENLRQRSLLALSSQKDQSDSPTIEEPKSPDIAKIKEKKEGVISVSPLDSSSMREVVTKLSETGDAASIALSVSKHSQEMSEHLKNLATAIKDNQKENFDALSIEQSSSRLEEEFTGKASKDKRESPITRICITGGPCAGKTTALSELSLVLTQMGFRVLQVPEAIMILKKGGCQVDTSLMTFPQAVKFQKLLIKLQMDLESLFIDIATMSPKHSIILIDRGVMDGQAYVNEDVWQAILDETGWSTIQLRDKRYEAVVHMMTAAEGAEEFYMSAQTHLGESIEQARHLDKRLIEAWVGHPQFNIVKNTKKGFKTKIDYALKRVLSFIGMPQPTNLTRKYLLASDKSNPEINVPTGVKKESFQLEETFMTTKVGQANILRKVGKNDAFTYSHEMRYEVNGEKIQKKRQITAREYIELNEKEDQSSRRITKLRQCFIYQRQYFMLETFNNLKHYPSVLRVENTSESSKTKLPPFLKILREVTNDNDYETWFMARQDYEMPEADVQAIQKTLLEELFKQHSENGVNFAAEDLRREVSNSGSEADLVVSSASTTNTINTTNLEEIDI